MLNRKFYSESRFVGCFPRDQCSERQLFYHLLGGFHFHVAIHCNLGNSPLGAVSPLSRDAYSGARGHLIGWLTRGSINALDRYSRLIEASITKLGILVNLLWGFRFYIAIELECQGLRSQGQLSQLHVKAVQGLRDSPTVEYQIHMSYQAGGQSQEVIVS